MRIIFPQTTFRYLAGRVVVPVLLTLTAFTLVDVLGEGSDRFSGWMSSGNTMVGLEYLALRVPFMVSQLLPVSLLGGIMLAFLLLHRAGEIVAFQALGISRLRIALPAFVVATVLGLFDFALAEGVVPVTNYQAHELLSPRAGSRTNNSDTVGETWVRTKDGFMVATSYDRGRTQLKGVTVFQMGAYPEVQTILQVERAIWDGQKWKLFGVRALKVRNDQEIFRVLAGYLPINASPVDLTGARLSNPEDFSLAEIGEFISELRRKGLDPAGYLVVRALKFALPASCVILAALGIAFSLEVRPRISGLGVKLALALATGVGYWIILGFTVSLGKSGVLPATLAAWLPDFLFGLVALSLFLFGEELKL
jgi:lipopolysaccharide export system permease protein